VKILYLGDISPGQTCVMRMRALQRLGHEVVGVNTVQPWRQAAWLRRQIQRRLCRGSVINGINAAVIEAAGGFRPELVWADKQEFLLPETLVRLRRAGTRLVSFTPDPYFTLNWKRTPLMDAALEEFDLFAYCKTYERAAYEAIGKQAIYMPLGYCDETHRPLPSSDQRWHCTVSFLGGWEPRRERYLHEVAVAGSDLKIWGAHWEFLRDGKWSLRRKFILDQFSNGERYHVRKDLQLAVCLQGGEVYGDDYARALTGAKIGLGFLRKVCPDQHTTRTFEIPACGSMLLADRTDEHREFFEEGVEAEFFADEEEMLDKVRFYSTHEDTRARIAAAGRERCKRGGYSYLERMQDALEEVFKT
jgi:spore maturation protein CgeB